MRDYAHEDWIPWYVRDTAGWLELSLAARGAAEGIARKMGHNGTEIPLGSRGLRGLARTLGCSWNELEPALIELFATGPNGEPSRLVHDLERNSIRDPEAAARRRPTSTERVRNHRSKVRQDPDQVHSPETTETVSPVPPVSSPSETVTSVPSPLLSSDLSLGSSGSDPDLPDRSPMPAWVEPTVEAVSANTGETFDVGVVWTTYQGSRGSARRPVGASDFQKFLGSWAANQKRDRVNARDRGSGKRGAEITKQPFDANAPWMKVGS